MSEESELKELVSMENLVKTSSTKRKIEERERVLINILKKFSPGTSLRTSLDDLMRARMGGLIVLECDGAKDLVHGGFKVNTKFNPQRLVELAKMDGAILISEDLKKITIANALLSPDVEIKSTETGTRHQAAERTAKQLGTIVMAVSERKNKITIYYKDIKHVLEKSPEVLRRATETLQILEKQKEVYKDLITNLNILEINNLVTMSDVCKILQRIEIITRVSDMVKRYLIELGKEGIIVSMRLKELMMGLSSEKDLILNDYFGGEAVKAEGTLKNMNFDYLIETSNISKMLFKEVHDKPIFSHGIRILKKTNLSDKDIVNLISKFKTLDKVFNADKDSLIEVLSESSVAEAFIEDLDNLREKILVGKQI